MAGAEDVTAAGVLETTGTGMVLVLMLELDCQLFHPELAAAVGVETEEVEDGGEEEDEEEVVVYEEVEEELDEPDEPQEEPALTENCVESGKDVSMCLRNSG